MGGSDPETWVYRCTTPGPNESTVVDVRQSRILHLMYQQSDKPWQGVGPLADCQESHNLAQALETRLRQEVSGPVGAMVPMPDGGGPVDGLEKDVNAMRGGIRLPPSTANNWNQGAVQGGAPRTDWRPLRIGADPSDTLRGLRSDTARDILAACGVPGGTDRPNRRPDSPGAAEGISLCGRDACCRGACRHNPPDFRLGRIRF